MMPPNVPRVFPLRAAGPTELAAPVKTKPKRKTKPKTKPKVDTDTDTDSKQRLAPMYRVLIHNDEVTPMEYVVQILNDVFRKSKTEAVGIMLTAHHSGVALVAVLPLEEAEFRVDRAHSLARTRKYPLTFTYEPSD